MVPVRRTHWIGTSFEQGSNDVRVPLDNRGKQCGFAVFALVVRICAGVEQGSDDLRVTFAGGVYQRGVPKSVLGVGVGAGFEQGPDDFNSRTCGKSLRYTAVNISWSVGAMFWLKENNSLPRYFNPVEKNDYKFFNLLKSKTNK